MNSSDQMYLLQKYGPSVVLATSSTAIGIILIFDDSKDFGKADRITHHAYTGTMFFIFGLIFLAFVVSQMMREYNMMQTKRRKAVVVTHRQPR